MLNRTILTLLILLTINLLQAQDIQVLNPENGTQVTDTLTITGNTTHDYSQNLWVYNASSNDLGIKVKFDIIDLAKNAYYAYCWDQCYGSVRSGHTSGVLTVSAGDTNKTSLRVDYDPQGYEGYSLFRLSVFSDNSNDTAVVYIAFDIKASTPVIDPATTLSIYPNPATRELTVKSPELNGATVELINLLGKTVYKSVIKDSKSLINVEDYLPGVYILKISRDTQTQILKKVIITH